MTRLLTQFSPELRGRQMKNERPDIGLVADAALGELHRQAKIVERVAMRLPSGPDRDELV